MKIPLYKAEGIIIKKYNSGEFDSLLVVYTKDFGKILVKAKSLRKKLAKLKENLELFNHVHLMLAKGKNIDTIAAVYLYSSFPNAKQNLTAVSTLYYLAELIDKMIVAPEKDARIWEMLRKAFYLLEQNKPNKDTIKKLLNRFEYNLLVYLGHQPEEEKDDYLQMLQNIAEAKIEARDFLVEILSAGSWG